MAEPKDNDGDERILRLTGYHCKFVKNYGIIARPLTQLLKKGKFEWGPEAKIAFIALKNSKTTTPVLGLPNFSDMFIIETDEFDKGIGAVLAQNGRPLAYMSKALGQKKHGGSVYSKEMLAIMKAIRMWQPYLLCRHFQI